MGNVSYESFNRGTMKNAWVFESDGKTPLLGEVGRPLFFLFVPQLMGRMIGEVFK